VPKGAKSVACVRDIRDFPWQAYVLADDGRKARAVAEQRRALAMQLATHADGDGTRISVGINRLMSNLGWSKRTLYRRLEDLRRLELVAEKDGLTKERGTALRRLNVAALTASEAGVPHSIAEVPDSQKQECQIDRPEVPDSAAGVPDSIAGVPRIGGTQPSSFTVHQTAHPTGAPETGAGWEGWITTLPSELDGAVPNKEQRRTIEEQLRNHGQQVMVAAVRRWVAVREMDIAGLRANKWGAWLRECAPHIQSALQQKQEADEKQNNAAATESFVRQQMTEHAKFMEYEAPRPNEVDPSEYIKD
jgi:hypothetical protein